MIDRRTVLAAAGLSLLGASASRSAAARKALTLELAPATLPLRAGQNATPVWRFAGDVPRFTQGDGVDVTISNRLPAPVVISWRGLDGHPELEPFLARGPIAAGQSANFALLLRHAGTLLVDARLMSAALPLPVLPFIVEERDSQADRDEVLLIEDWRLRVDGSAIPPGTDVASAETTYTLNGKTAFKLDAPAGRRLRLRVINGAQRNVLAVQFSNADVRVVAIDSQPSEPFPAREGRLVVAPGTRIDVIVALNTATSEITVNNGARSVKLGDISGQPSTIDAAPLPSNGLPEKLALQTALRVTLDLNGGVAPDTMSLKIAPAFRVSRDWTVVLALTNSSDAPAIFRLHGHHTRLLDRLDDGWKPFWLDTVAVPAKQTVRVAFGATNPGAYLIETFGAEWASAVKLQSYVVVA